MLPSLGPLLLHLPDPSVQLSLLSCQLFPPDLPVPARDQKWRVWRGALVWRKGLGRGAGVEVAHWQGCPYLHDAVLGAQP